MKHYELFRFQHYVGYGTCSHYIYIVNKLQSLLDIINNTFKLLFFVVQNHHNWIIFFQILIQLVLLSSRLTEICIVQCFIIIIVLFHIRNSD